MTNKAFVPSQMYRELQSIIGMNPFLDCNSASRIQMYGSHLGQKLVIAGLEEPLQTTGMNIEFGKNTFSVDMPANAHIIRRIERYFVGGAIDSIKMNPEVVLIYEDAETGEIGCVSLPTFASYHSYLGFEYKPTKALRQMTSGAYVSKGVKLLDSPGVTEDGNYMYGINLNTVFMSHPGVSEDGAVICRDVLPRLAFKKYERRTVEWGRKNFPINLYGDDEIYKPFPDIGEYIRDDNILMAFRTHAQGLSITQQSRRNTKRVDPYFDNIVYGSGSGGKIIDIIVDVNSDYNFGPSPMDEQLEKYIRQTTRFYKEILEVYNKVKYNKGTEPNITPDFHVLMRHAIFATESERGNKVTKQYCGTPIDDFRVEFVIEYEVIPNIGFKITDEAGNKGVICHIAEPHEMPVDAAGNRADIIMDSYSRINRMNPGGLYSHYVNGSARDTRLRICEMLGMTAGDRFARVKLEEMYYKDRERFEAAQAYLIGFYKITAPAMYRWYESGTVGLEEALDRMAKVVTKWSYLYNPPEHSLEPKDMTQELERLYPQVYGPVTYIGYSGKQVTTQDNVRIAPLYWMLLEKIADDGSAIGSGKFQHHGVPAQPSKSDKYALPWRAKPVKFAGETEFRLIVSYSGVYLAAEIIDMNNSFRTHEVVVDSLLTAKNPSNIPRLIDRRKIPYGGSKPLQSFNHTLQCAGIKMKYVR